MLFIHGLFARNTSAKLRAAVVHVFRWFAVTLIRFYELGQTARV
jgi:hypothetical protein